MAGYRLGLVIGAAFGVIYMVVNAGALGAPLGPLLQLVGLATFVGLLFALRRSRLTPIDVAVGPPRYGRGFWLVVIGEGVAAVAGIAVFKGLLGLPQAVLPWLSSVVGLHFFGLARGWSDRSLAWLGAGITACGALGLAAAAVGAGHAAIATIAGVAPGALLLAGSWWGAMRTGVLRREPSRVD